MLQITPRLIEDISMSIFFVFLTYFIVLIGLLIVKYYTRKIPKKETRYFLLISCVLAVHVAIDGITYFYPNPLLTKISLTWNFILSLSIIITFYLIWKNLNKFWAYTSLLVMIISFYLNITIYLIPHMIYLEFYQLLSIFILLMSIYFLIMDFLINR